MYQPGPIFVNVDKVQLTQVISNLLNDAIKNTSEGSKDFITIWKVVIWLPNK